MLLDLNKNSKFAMIKKRNKNVRMMGRMNENNYFLL
jgi:hypothetical protein